MFVNLSPLYEPHNFNDIYHHKWTAFRANFRRDKYLKVIKIEPNVLASNFERNKKVIYQQRYTQHNAPRKKERKQVSSFVFLCSKPFYTIFSLSVFGLGANILNGIYFFDRIVILYFKEIVLCQLSKKHFRTRYITNSKISKIS